MLSTPPAPGKARPYRFPGSTTQSSPSGAKIVIAPIHRHPLVTVTAVFHRAGADQDPAGKEGLADLTAAMLLEGAAARNGAELVEYFETLGSSLSSSADWDAALLGFTVHPSRLDAAIAGLRDVLREPRMADEDLARLQAEHRAGRLLNIADPRSLADSAFDWCCYGPASRYRRPAEGTTASVSALTRDDITGFWRDNYVPDALTIVIAGDVSETAASAAAERLVADWPKGNLARRVASDERRSHSSTTTLVEKPGAVQAELRIGHVGARRNDPRYFPLTVLNAVLGGLFSSRINLNLRERHGYTYGAFSSFDWRLGAGPWQVSTAVKSEVCVAAIREVLSEIDRIRAEPITTDELELAANYLVGVFPLRYETTAAVAAALASREVFGLPADYYDTYREQMSAVTPAAILDVAAAYLDPPAMQIVIAGDPATLKSDLEAFAAGGMQSISDAIVEQAP